jgi:lipopolysaccharide transport system ATP-binding protein
LSAEGRSGSANSPLGGSAAAESRNEAARVEADVSAPLLALAGVGKDYAKVETRGGRVRLVWDLLRGHGAANVFRALDDVSFTMQRGASLGIVGENGAGKSTLLKVVAGVIQPTRGTVSVNGRVGALLELGSGFHPEYTGLANIDLAAALLGLAPSELGAKREEIIAFADLGEHIHDPLKQYSSGMVVRLGFAVATALSPDVLITDEVLAVGDESFQKRCIAWMERYLANGGTLLLCSHSMYHIQKLCTDALWLKDGRVERYGAAAEVAQAYLAYHEEKDASARRPVSAAVAASSGWYAINALTVAPPDTLAQGDALTVSGEVFSPDGRTPVVLIGIVRADGTPVYGVATDMENAPPLRLADQRYAFSLTFPDVTLLPGRYQVRAHALDPEGVRLFDHVEHAFTVTGATRELGFVRLPHRWQSPA